MICNNCGMRWADLPPNFPDVMLTKEEDEERHKVFRNDEVQCCPTCIEELNELNPLA